MAAVSRDRHIRHVQWLRVDLTIDRLCKQLPELSGIYVCWSEYGLICVLTCPAVVVVLCEHAHLRP